MRVTRLKLENVRAIDAAEIGFQPGFNLVVGVNGVGKSTILDALAVCLSHVVRRVNELQSYPVNFERGDIRKDASALDIVCHVEHGEETERYCYSMPRERTPRMPKDERRLGDDSSVVDAPAMGRPMAVLFSTNRAVPSARAPTRDSAAGGVTAAFSRALSDRTLLLSEFEAWMRVQEALKSERSAAGRALESLREAVGRFLPDYSNLRTGGARVVRGVLLVDHGAMTLPVRRLSDGERGLLAMVIDLTRRLTWANPEMKDPAAEAEAVVLIDEIELHLHPAWQRRIVENLTKTFPKCQFIATTHSPQVIGEVEQDRIHIMADGEVYSPSHSFGVDSSRVLEEVMDTESRSVKISELLRVIARKFDDGRYDTVRELLPELVGHLGEDDPEITRIRTLLDFMEEGA